LRPGLTGPIARTPGLHQRTLADLAWMELSSRELDLPPIVRHGTRRPSAEVEVRKYVRRRINRARGAIDGVSSKGVSGAIWPRHLSH